jgi:hypothetical protein
VYRNRTGKVLFQPEGMVKVVIWLGSEQVSFVMEHPMTIDGGYVAE